MKPVMISLLVMAFANACSSSPPAASTPAGGPAIDDKRAAACTSDADCVVVETACCDHCNGGKAEAYAKAFADAHRPHGCEQTMCTEMACGAATVTCMSGTCTVAIQALEPPPAH